MSSPACAGTDPALWFPNEDTTARKALNICQECPLSVVKACATAALHNGEQYGIWAGVRLNRMKRARDLTRLRAIAGGDTTHTQVGA